MAAGEISSCSPPSAYLPASIVQVPRPVVDYARYMTEAPVVALAPLRADGIQHSAMRRSKRDRTRLQVGSTNRWRLPQSLLSDLLGISQATKAAHLSEVKPFNSSYSRVCTAEGRHRYLNDSDADVQTVTIPSPLPLKSSFLGSRANKSFIENRLAKSAPVISTRQRGHPTSSRMNTYIPDMARPSLASDVFLFHSKLNTDEQRLSPADVVLHCRGTDFDLHSCMLKTSPVLSSLLEEAVMLENADNACVDPAVRFSTSMSRYNATIKISWEPTDMSIGLEAIAITLGYLYHGSFDVETTSLAPVLLAASELKHTDLARHCVDRMKTCIDHSTLCPFYVAARKSGQDQLVNSCIKWLELHLVPIMMTKIQLRNIPIALMEAVLRSPRLFTYSEYHLYICLCLWLFLRINNQVQLMPTTTNIITYFNSLPKHSSFLETEGEAYVPLFDCLRLHGIAETAHFDNIRRMNILPQESMVSLLSQHYSALQSGGDMALMVNFSLSSVRKGFIIDESLPYHTEILSLHGFHFQLKTTKTGDTYTFYMQRLRPSDPVLSFRQCERQTFSMRPDRDVTYSITVQTYRDGVQTLHSTGMETQRFGLTGKQVRSKVLSLAKLTPPLYVTFSILFPQS